MVEDQLRAGWTLQKVMAMLDEISLGEERWAKEYQNDYSPPLPLPVFDLLP